MYFLLLKSKYTDGLCIERIHYCDGESSLLPFSTTDTVTSPTEPLESTNCPTEPLESTNCPTEPLESTNCPNGAPGVYQLPYGAPGVYQLPYGAPGVYQLSYGAPGVYPTEPLESTDCPTEPLESTDCPTEPLESTDCPTEPLESTNCPTEPQSVGVTNFTTIPEPCIEPSLFGAHLSQHTQPPTSEIHPRQTLRGTDLPYDRNEPGESILSTRCNIRLSLQEPSDDSGVNLSTTLAKSIRKLIPEDPSTSFTELDRLRLTLKTGSKNMISRSKLKEMKERYNVLIANMGTSLN